MIRKVVFKHADEEKTHRFEICYSGTLLAMADQTYPKPDKLELRNSAKLVRKLQAIGTPKLGDDDKPLKFQTSEDFLMLRDGDHTIEFTQPELDLLTSRVFFVRWHATRSADSVDVIDWLDASDKVEPSEEKPVTELKAVK